MLTDLLCCLLLLVVGPMFAVATICVLGGAGWLISETSEMLEGLGGGIVAMAWVLGLLVFVFSFTRALVMFVKVLL